jgi:hypothetical protein
VFVFFAILMGGLGTPLKVVQLAPVFAVLLAVGVVWPLVTAFRRKVTLTTDTLVIRKTWQTYRIPLREIRKIRRGAANSRLRLMPAVKFVTAGDHYVWTLSFGWRVTHPMQTVADAVRAAGGHVTVDEIF